MQRCFVPRQCPRVRTYDFSRTICSDPDHRGSQVKDSRIRALIHQGGENNADRVDQQPGFDTAMPSGVGDRPKRPLPYQADEGQENVEDLDDRYRFDDHVEGFRVEVPEDFGPDAALDTGGDLVAGRRQRGEARPMGFDQSTHGVLYFLFTRVRAA